MKGWIQLKRIMTVIAAVAAGMAWAATLDGSYVIVKPDPGPLGVDAAIESGGDRPRTGEVKPSSYKILRADL